MEKKQRGIFLAFAFIWSFVFWGLTIFLAVKGNIRLLENADLLKTILRGALGGKLAAITIFSALAGYGPLFAAFFVLTLFPATRTYFVRKFRLTTPLKYVLQILALFILISALPAIPLALSNGLAENPSWSLIGFVVLFFLYQFFTAGTEEVGWRGYLLPSMLKNKTPWDASVHIGIIWALWHTPIVLYVFYAQGLSIPQIMASFVGFVAGTIAMSAVHTYYYLKTKNILFNMFIHAIGNTIPMFIGMMVADSYQISVFVQVLLWVFVIILAKKNKKLFDQIYQEPST